MIKKILVIVLFAILYNCEELIEVEDISSETVNILAPTDNTTLNNTTVNFSWHPLEFAESYQLQVTFPDFNNAQVIVEDTLLSTTSYTKILDQGSYQWRIKAINFAYETQYTTQNLTIEE
ncbi:MAG: fibronectin type III domain-containing protein [Winogradskyella sp.]